MSKEYRPILASAARTATAVATVACESPEGLFFINVTAVSGTASITVTIAGLSPEGAAYTILASAAITSTGLTVLRVSPQLTAAANTIAKDMLPQALRVTSTHANADSITYSVSFIGTES